MAKILITYDSGETQELSDGAGVIAMWWKDSDQGEIGYLTWGGTHSDRLKMVSLLLEGLAESVAEATLNDEDQLSLDQLRATKQVQEWMAGIDNNAL